MFGLEPTGGIPSLSAVPSTALVYYAESLLEALNFVLNHSFFVTSDMSNRVKRNSLNGVGALICFFLARDGYTVLDARDIYIQPDGIIGYDVKKVVPARDLVYGIEILFMGTDKKQRRASYFQIDVFNKSPQLKRFSDMVEIFNPQAAIIKSASYLMSDRNFTIIKDIVLARSPMIIQDDSGVSYASFKKTDWDISYYGKYHKPIPVFQYQYQRSLEADVARYSKGPIKFIYGYGYGYPDATYHLIVARKKQKP
jgi:hypothetical protein